MFQPIIYDDEIYKVLTNLEIPGVDEDRYYVSNHGKFLIQKQILLFLLIIIIKMVDILLLIFVQIMDLKKNYCINW